MTKGKAPAYLGSSFAFLAPAGIVISEMGYEYALGGFVVVGFCAVILAAIIYKFGSDWINVVLPPAAMGPVVALIGLELAGSAAENAGLLDETIRMENVIVFFVTLGVAVFGSVVFRGFLSSSRSSWRWWPAMWRRSCAGSWILRRWRQRRSSLCPISSWRSLTRRRS